MDFELPGEEFRFYSKWMENCWRVIMAVLIIHIILKTPSGLSLWKIDLLGGGGQVRMGEGRRVRAEAAGHLQLGLQL